jgi:hypothetical protein
MVGTLPYHRLGNHHQPSPTTRVRVEVVVDCSTQWKKTIPRDEHAAVANMMRWDRLRASPGLGATLTPIPKYDLPLLLNPSLAIGVQ